jgi:hypothetical protein
VSTVAVLRMLLPTSTVLPTRTTRVMSELPTASVGLVQTTSGPAEQVQPGPSAETSAVPPGSKSSTTSVSAVEGPSLVTCRV